MKSIITCLTLLSFTMLATSASISTPDLTEVSEETSVDADTLKTAAKHFLGTLEEDSPATVTVGKLLSSMGNGESMDALSALKSLAQMNFSKEQLKAYGAILAQVIPSLLTENFDLKNGEAGQYVDKAIGYFGSENFAAASKAVSKAMQYVDADSLQSDLLNAIITAYAPMLKGVDLNQAIGIGKSLLSETEPL